ncbi:Hypothetical predicted protein, partial [Olea europaea subsp. europaea]
PGQTKRRRPDEMRTFEARPKLAGLGTASDRKMFSSFAWIEIRDSRVAAGSKLALDLVCPQASKLPPRRVPPVSLRAPQLVCRPIDWRVARIASLRAANANAPPDANRAR